MPNWTYNDVAISGSAEGIKQVRETLKGEKGEFDFNKLIPMPESLDIESGSSTNLGLACFRDEEFKEYSSYSWFSDRYNGAKTKKKLLSALSKSDPRAVELGRQAADNIKKYGVPTWYEWCRESWGTKWNACDVKMLDDGGTYLSYQFDTAWCAPYPIATKLKRLCHELGLRIEWMAEDEAEDGRYDVIEGVL